MRSFVKIKSSRNGTITLSFTDEGKSCHSCEFLCRKYVFFTLFAKIKFSRKFRIYSNHGGKLPHNLPHYLIYNSLLLKNLEVESSPTLNDSLIYFHLFTLILNDTIYANISSKRSHLIKALSRQNLSSWFRTKRDSN